MKKPPLTMTEVRQLHQAGRLEEAKQAYLDMLTLEPKNTEVLHLLGILCVELDDLDAAQDYMEAAISLEPDHPTFNLHLASILKAKGLFGQAARILQSIVAAHPNFAAAYNNLGTVYYAEAKLADAIAAFQSAIAIQTNYVDAYYNLGLALSKSNRLDEAFNVYQALIELAPQHAGGQFQLGCLFMQQQKYKDAVLH